MHYLIIKIYSSLNLFHSLSKTIQVIHSIKLFEPMNVFCSRKFTKYITFTHLNIKAIKINLN